MLLPFQVGCSKLTIWARPKISSKNDVRIVFIRLRTLKSDKNYLVLDANLDATKKYDFKNSFYIVYQCFKVLKPHKKRSRLESRFWTPYLSGRHNYIFSAWYEIISHLRCFWGMLTYATWVAPTPMLYRLYKAFSLSSLWKNTLENAKIAVIVNPCWKYLQKYLEVSGKLFIFANTYLYVRC